MRNNKKRVFIKGQSFSIPLCYAVITFTPQVNLVLKMDFHFTYVYYNYKINYYCCNVIVTIVGTFLVHLFVFFYNRSRDWHVGIILIRISSGLFTSTDGISINSMLCGLFYFWFCFSDFEKYNIIWMYMLLERLKKIPYF